MINAPNGKRKFSLLKKKKKNKLKQASFHQLLCLDENTYTCI